MKTYRDARTAIDEAKRAAVQSKHAQTVHRMGWAFVFVPEGVPCNLADFDPSLDLSPARPVVTCDPDGQTHG